MKESEVKRAVMKYFRQQGYYVPKAEFNIGVRPDVVAFKWVEPYEIMNIAVECKPTKYPRTLIETGFTQAREYQGAFQYVYLATPRLDDKSLGTIRESFRHLRIGLLTVDNNFRVTEEFKPEVSPRLYANEFTHKVRQRAAAILTYRDVFGQDFNLNVQDSDALHCYMKEVAANFLLSNAYSSGNYSFGICIEQKRNVEKTLGTVTHQLLSEMLTNLSGEYFIDLQYIDTYKPREVSWSILSKAVENISENDVKWILNYCKDKDWKIRFTIMKNVWKQGELLSREEHRERIEAIRKELLPLRHKLTSTHT